MVTTVWDASRQKALEDAVEYMQRNDRIRRGQTQMTLGKMIFRLNQLPRDMPMAFLANPHSYRGFYTDLALEMPNEELPTTVGFIYHMLANQCLDKSFEGYKGGKYVMTWDTPLWIAEYSRLGQKITGVDDDGYLELAGND